MKFIFPQNYSLKPKLLGFIEYSSIIINIIWMIIIFSILNLLFSSINLKIFLFIILCFPLLILSIFNFNGENIITTSLYIIKYLLKPKVLLYNKNCKY